MRILILALCFFALNLNAQVDTTLVEIDTSLTVKMQNKIEVSRAAGVYTIRQYQDESTFVQTQVTGKKNAVERLTLMLKQLNKDEALLMRQLVILRERKKEVRAARELYK